MNAPSPSSLRYQDRTAAFLGAFDERDALRARLFWALFVLSTLVLLASFWMWSDDAHNIPALFVELMVLVWATIELPRAVAKSHFKRRMAEVAQEYPLDEYERTLSD